MGLRRVVSPDVVFLRSPVVWHNQFKKTHDALSASASYTTSGDTTKVSGARKQCRSCRQTGPAHHLPGKKGLLAHGLAARRKAASIAYTLIDTAKMNRLDPQAWLAEVLL